MVFHDISWQQTEKTGYKSQNTIHCMAVPAHYMQDSGANDRPTDN